MPRPSRTLGHHTQLVRLRPVKLSLPACHLPAQSASETGAWAAWRRSDRWLGTRSTGLYAEEAVWEAREELEEGEGAAETDYVTALLIAEARQRRRLQTACDTLEQLPGATMAAADAGR